MKLILSMLVLTASLFGAHIDEFASQMGYYRDYDTALLEAQKKNKPIMLVVVGDYCPWCRKFERQTLQKNEVAIYVEDHFIPVIVDRNLDKEHYPPTYYSLRIPTVFFIEPKKQELLFESMGYLKQSEFLETMRGIK